MAKKEKPQVKVRQNRDITKTELREPDPRDLDKSPQIVRKDALLKLVQYLKKNHLNPEIDYSKDPEHGPKLKKYYDLIRVAEQKIISQPKKLIKPEVHRKVKTINKQPGVYDYPQIDGKPMSEQMKKKYRRKMRRLLQANMEIEKAKGVALDWAMRWDNSDDPTLYKVKKTGPKVRDFMVLDEELD